MMTIATLIVVLLLVGVALALFPVDPVIRNLILAIIVVTALVWLLTGFGLLPAPRFRW